MSVRQAHNKCS